MGSAFIQVPDLLVRGFHKVNTHDTVEDGADIDPAARAPSDSPLVLYRTMV